MTTSVLLGGSPIPYRAPAAHIRKYSTTGDILAFKRCGRQYGVFGVRGFRSASMTQLYFGTLVHDVMDRINRNYRMDPVLPTQAEIDDMVQAAHDRLVLAGIRAYNSAAQQAQVAKIIGRFVQLVGQSFFPHVHETEYRLERALQTEGGRNYVLDGVVDIVAGAVSHDLGLPYPTEPEDEEIWDYKSGRMPERDSQELRDYTYQMRVYAELFRLQRGEYPSRCVLVFLGELGNDAHWQGSQEARDFPLLFYPVHPMPREVARAMTDFNTTVEAIELQRALSYGDQWPAPPSDRAPGIETCDACDLRFSCSTYEQVYGRARSERLTPL